jgi:hypothetical protein
MVHENRQCLAIVQLEGRFKAIAAEHPVAVAVDLIDMTADLGNWKPRQHSDINASWVVSVDEEPVRVMIAEVALIEDANGVEVLDLLKAEDVRQLAVGLS